MSNFIDETGNKYGMLTVLYKDNEKSESKKVKWICQCECGNIKSVLGASLRKGSTKSCGCLARKLSAERKIKNLEGQHFGKLVALYYNFSGPGKGKWHCKCECGNECDIVSGSLTSGASKSCGCLRKDLNKEKGIIRSNIYPGMKFKKLTVIEYVGSYKNRNYWKCLCDCGNETIVSANSLKTEHIGSCGCVQSYGNMKIEHFLQKRKIPFKSEFSFPNLLSEKNYPLRFDFCIFKDFSLNEIDFLIEYDGDIHFVSRENGWNTAETLKKRQERDKIKDDYCLTNNIKLVRINYKENLDKRLEEIFNEL